MTRKDLKEYRAKKHEIAYLRRKLAARPAVVADSVTGSSTEFPYTEGVIPIRGIDVQERERQHRRLQELEQACRAVEAFIEGIVDHKLKLFFTLKYVDGQGWEQVATNAGDEIDGESVRIAVWRYLKKSS